MSIFIDNFYSFLVRISVLAIALLLFFSCGLKIRSCNRNIEALSSFVSCSIGQIITLYTDLRGDPKEHNRNFAVKQTIRARLGWVVGLRQIVRLWDLEL